MEKIVVFSLAGVVIVCLGLLIWQRYFVNTQFVPSYGGTYTEGVVVTSQDNINDLVSQLSKIGLVRLNREGQLEGALATSWEISQDQKTYTFKLTDKINSADLVATVRREKPQWEKIGVNNPDTQTIQFVLTEPYSPFLAGLVEPIFPYGPYVVKKDSKQEIDLAARVDFIFGKPYINEIVLKIYPNQTSLNQALKNKEVEGAGEVANETILPKKFIKYDMPLPRYLMLFFNVNSEMFTNKDTRKKLANNEPLPSEISFDLLTSNSAENISVAENLKNQWQSLGAKVNVVALDAKDLEKDMIPNRKYNALLYGIDYGYDPDPYPFWHSSQIGPTGLNLSNFANVQADKLLEEARQNNNPEERAKKYQEFQKIIDEEKPAITIKQIIWHYATSSRIKGIAQHQGYSPADRFLEVWRWYIKEKRIKK